MREVRAARIGPGSRASRAARGAALGFAVLLAAVAPCAGSCYFDGFDTDDPGCDVPGCQSGPYRYTVFNGDGSFNIGGGTLNISITSGFANGTKSVVLDDGIHYLEVGEEVSVDVPPAKTFLVAGLGSRPISWGHLQVRIRRDTPLGQIRIQLTDDIVSPVPDPAPGSWIKLIIRRLTDTNFQCLYDTGDGPTPIGSTFTNWDLAGSGGLHVGMQGFETYPTTFPFDNLRIAPLGDADCDTVSDGVDNCPDVPNGPAEDDQADADRDGRGDACDCAPLDAGSAALPRQPRLDVVKVLPGTGLLLLWDDLVPASGTATQYEVASDTLTALAMSGEAAPPCLAAGVTDPFFDDARPLSGQDVYYLVRGVNACGPPAATGWGLSSAGDERPACP